MAITGGDAVRTGGGGSAAQSLASDSVGQTEVNDRRVEIRPSADDVAPLAPAANCIDDDRKADVDRAVRSLRGRTKKRAWQHGAFGGFNLGVAALGISGAVSGKVVGAAIGATIGSAVPFVGTAAGAIVGAVLGALVTVAVPTLGVGLLAAKAGKVEADRITPLDALARGTGRDPDTFAPVASKGVRDVPSAIPSTGARQGGPLRPEPIGPPQAAPVRLGATTGRALADALAEIGQAKLDPDGRAEAERNLRAAVNARLLSGRPVDPAYVQQTAEACIDAEAALQGIFDVYQGLDDRKRQAAVRASYRELVASAIQNEQPLSPEARFALLAILCDVETGLSKFWGRWQRDAHQAFRSKPIDEQRRELERDRREVVGPEGQPRGDHGLFLKMFKDAIEARLSMRKTVDRPFLEEAAFRTLDTEGVLRGEREAGDYETRNWEQNSRYYRPTSEKGTIWQAVGRAYPQMVSTQVAVARPISSRGELAEQTRFRLGFGWPETAKRVDEVKGAAEAEARGLVGNLCEGYRWRSHDDRRFRMEQLAQRLCWVFARSALHTMARRGHGLAFDGTPDGGDRHRRCDPSDIRRDFRMRLQNALEDTLVRVYGDFLAEMVTAIGEKAGEQPEADIRQLREVTARAFEPDARFDPDAPPLDDAAWAALGLDRDDGALQLATDWILDTWQGAYAAFVSLRDLAAEDERGGSHRA